MTELQTFAAHALTGLLAHYGRFVEDDDDTEYEELITIAYDIAERMMREYYDRVTAKE